MEPLDLVMLEMLEMGKELGLSVEDVANRATVGMTKQNRYKWRKKFAALSSAASPVGCPFTGNFLDELGIL
jgi:hypothetical protein